MILDVIENADMYKNVCPNVCKALEAMKQYSSENYPTGRVDIDGDNLFLLLNEYETSPLGDALTEAHRKYIDVMYMVEGEETIYVKPTDRLETITQEYDPEIEVLLAKTDADTTPIRLTAGQFIVLFPQDAHAPAHNTETQNKVKKIIGKVKIN